MTLPEYLAKLKMLLGIDPDDTTKDHRLIFVLETVIQAVLTFCHIPTIPTPLEHVVLQMAEDYHRGKYPTEFEQAAIGVQSVKRGDVTTTFFGAKAAVVAGPGAAFVQGYAAQLIAYRKLRW